MNLIERLAARFDFYRGKPPTELIVFRNQSEARGAGFRGASHPDFNHLRAWWPGQGLAGLMGRPIQRVTINKAMSATMTSEGRLYDLLRKRQMVWGDRAIWVELA